MNREESVTEENLHVRMSVLNPGPEVTPLKFRSWLRTEAADIDRMTRATNLAHQASIIRIFLPDRLRVAIGQTKLDRIIQDVVNKFETIIRVELQAVAGPLTTDEMMRAVGDMKAEVDSLSKKAEDNASTTGKPTLH